MNKVFTPHYFDHIYQILLHDPLILYNEIACPVVLNYDKWLSLCIIHHVMCFRHFTRMHHVMCFRHFARYKYIKIISIIYLSRNLLLKFNEVKYT